MSYVQDLVNVTFRIQSVFCMGLGLCYVWVTVRVMCYVCDLACVMRAIAYVSGGGCSLYYVRALVCVIWWL